MERRKDSSALQKLLQGMGCDATETASIFRCLINKKVAITKMGKNMLNFELTVDELKLLLLIFYNRGINSKALFALMREKIAEFGKAKFELALYRLERKYHLIIRRTLNRRVCFMINQVYNSKELINKIVELALGNEVISKIEATVA